MKKVLGLDVGTASIGWALVKEAENEDEKSAIIRTGVRITLSSEEQSDFEEGKSVTINADRTRNRGARRNLDRYQDRRNRLIRILKESGFIHDESILSEQRKETHDTYALRAKAATPGERVEKEDLARIFLMINKKRGYKSNRNIKDDEDGQLIDDFATAKKLKEENKTPGEFTWELLKEEKKYIPSFYKSDLQNEFDKIWNKQKPHHPEELTDSFYDDVKGMSKTKIIIAFKKEYKITTAENKSKDKRLQLYQWRKEALTKALDIEVVAYVLAEIAGQIKAASGYLGAISDRNKQLHENGQTVGQYLYAQLLENPHNRLKNQIFYRQDYLDEFDKIWEAQKGFHPEMTDDLKKKIREEIIFYQRRLKSQKGLLSICELEGKELENKMVGPKVVSKSSHLFQQFKIWQRLNDARINDNVDVNDKRRFSIGQKQRLFEELNVRGNLSKEKVLKLLFENDYKKWELNFKELEGNETNRVLYEAFLKIVGNIKNKEYSLRKLSGSEAQDLVREVFAEKGFSVDILDFRTDLEPEAMEQQSAYRFWHLLYSYEGDSSKTGNEGLIQQLMEKYGFDEPSAKILCGVSFKKDYGNLSNEAIRKILPFMKEGHKYSEACEYAEYNHSHSETTEESKKRHRLEKMEMLPKNSLRNPAVEKILNQMSHVVNAVIEEYGKPDEIRLEMARELKSDKAERERATKAINAAKKRHDDIVKKLQKSPYNLSYVSRNDIIKYKLWEELEPLGHKTLYTQKYISPEQLFSNEVDVEHIIPTSRRFDDSFSNKTLEFQEDNKDKANQTAYDFIIGKYGEEGLEKYKKRVEDLYKKGKISMAKRNKLLMKGSEIPDEFIARDLRDTQYIVRKAKFMLKRVFKEVNTTTGSITERLRKDWQLMEVMKELNWDKYKELGLTDEMENRHGKKIRQIDDWNKRRDHRHHAMDAITVAFTKHSHVQYLNNLNAKSNKGSEFYGIQNKELYKDKHGKWLFKPPIPLEDLRRQVRFRLENTLVSFKAKNKVVTRNKNKTKKKGGYNEKIELTPRAPLHKETVYGKRYHYKVKDQKVGTKMDKATILKVANKKYREALLKRLEAFEGDPKKAFAGKNSPTKKPIYVDELQTSRVPEKVELVTLEEQLTIRKEIDKDIRVDKVIDGEIRKKLEERLEEYDNDPKKAFVNLEENPIWLKTPLPKEEWKDTENPTKIEKWGIPIKRVKQLTEDVTITKAISIHEKKDHNGVIIYDKQGKSVPVDFVKTGGNHHVAIYKDEKGRLQEQIVSYFEAVARIKMDIPLIDKTYKADEGWNFQFTMKRNEMFVFPDPKTGFDPPDIDLTERENYAIISPHLFRVQKLTTKDYHFRHHLETDVENREKLKDIKWKRVQKPEGLKGIVKVRINHLGDIVHVGEY